MGLSRAPWRFFFSFCLWFRVEGVGFRVEGVEFRVEGVGFRVAG